MLSKCKCKPQFNKGLNNKLLPQISHVLLITRLFLMELCMQEKKLFGVLTYVDVKHVECTLVFILLGSGKVGSSEQCVLKMIKTTQ